MRELKRGGRLQRTPRVPGGGGGEGAELAARNFKCRNQSLSGQTLSVKGEERGWEGGGSPSFCARFV